MLSELSVFLFIRQPGPEGKYRRLYTREPSKQRQILLLLSRNCRVRNEINRSSLGGRQTQQGHRKISGRVAEDALGLFYNDLSLRSKLVAIGCWNTIANRRAMFSENTKYAVLSKVASK